MPTTSRSHSQRTKARTPSGATRLPTAGDTLVVMGVAMVGDVVGRCGGYSTVNSAIMPWVKCGGASISWPLCSAAASASGVDPTGKKQSAP